MSFVPGVSAPAAPTRRVWFVAHGDGLVVREDPAGTPQLPCDDELAALGLAGAPVDYLGQLDDAHAFAVNAAAPPPAPWVVRGLRLLYVPFGEERFGVAGRAVQIAHWAATHRFCGRCGSATERMTGERAMRCPACGLVAYPRITPAIIVLVRRGDEALLARGARFPLPFYSTLAGFAEAGETLEETLVREVREEVGIEVRDLRYFGSQPWPFPHSLMVGFFAEWAGGELAIDRTEILDAQWFRADQLPTVPPPISIARRLIDAWLTDVRSRR
jgi:NAD+ diphosphatase